MPLKIWKAFSRSTSITSQIMISHKNFDLTILLVVTRIPRQWLWNIKNWMKSIESIRLTSLVAHDRKRYAFHAFLNAYLPKWYGLCRLNEYVICKLLFLQRAWVAITRRLLFSACMEWITSQPPHKHKHIALK